MGTAFYKSYIPSKDQRLPEKNKYSQNKEVTLNNMYGTSNFKAFYEMCTSKIRCKLIKKYLLEIRDISVSNGGYENS